MSQEASNKIAEAKANVQLMIQLFQDAIPEMEAMALAGQLEDILIKQYEKTGAETDTFKFYMKILKIVYMYSEQESRITKYKRIAENEAAERHIVRELYTRTLNELNKYDTVQELINTDTLNRYISACQNHNQRIQEKINNATPKE